MIGDVARTGTYRKAILGNAEVAFKDKVVLDVGAGMSSPEAELKCRIRYPVLHVCSGRSEACGSSRSVVDG